MLKKIPGYVWIFAGLIGGILSGGFLPETLNPVAVGTRAFINLIIKIVPILIFCALSPAIATLVKRGLAGKIAGSVVLWYVASSILAGLLGVVFSSLLFSIPFSSEVSGISSDWKTLFLAWPVLVLFTIAAPGLPAGIGTSLWAATLFASTLGLEDPTKATFIATWIALSGGLPDMFRTVINSTGDGFTAIVFNRFLDRFFKPRDREAYQ